MKKFYSFMALALLGTSSAMAQVSVDEIAGKYVLVGDEPEYYIDDHGFDPATIINIDKTGAKSFSLSNFFYDTSNYDGAQISLNGSFQDAGDWSNYPTVQNIRFEWDNSDVYLYNPAAESEDTEWFFFAENSFRLVTKKDADGNVILSLWPNNRIKLTYYTAADGNWNNDALEFKNLGAWQEGKEGSLHLQKLPQYQTVSKRGLAGEYTFQGTDADGNKVQYPVTIELDGTEYIMTGLFGDTTHPVTFTWDDTDAGIRANAVYDYDEEGNFVYGLYSFAPNGNLYISFTEDGNLAFDQSLIFTADGQNYLYLNEASTAEAGSSEESPLDKFIGKYVFTGTDPYCSTSSFAPAANYECEITVDKDELLMTGFLGNATDNNYNPVPLRGTYNEVLGTVTFSNDPVNGCFTYDDAAGIYYYIYDITLSVDKNEAGNLVLVNDGGMRFYAYGSDWLDASYSSLCFEKGGKMPEIEDEDPIALPTDQGATTAYFLDYDGNSIASSVEQTFTRNENSITLTNFLGSDKDLVLTMSNPSRAGYYNIDYAYGDGMYSGDYFYLFESEENYIECSNGETVDTFYPGYAYYLYSEDYDYLSLCYWSYTQNSWNYIELDMSNVFDPTAVTKVNADRQSGDIYDLQGRKVNAPAKGLYIQNGRKVVR